MRIYKRKDFLKLPEGTIFSSGEPYSFMVLYIKGESLKDDFYQQSLIEIQSFNSDEHCERFYEMEEKGSSYPINQSEGREGLFDDEMLYLVYEKEDIQYMIECLSNSVR